jgi:hypothetical protein
MSFEPLDWLPLADELGARTDEAARRAAVSRYYYGVFLKSRDTLTAAARMRPRYIDADHRGVVEALATQRRGGASTALDNLRRERNRADYDSNLAVGATHVTRARELAAEVQRICGPDWA